MRGGEALQKVSGKGVLKNRHQHVPVPTWLGRGEVLLLEGRKSGYEREIFSVCQKRKRVGEKQKERETEREGLFTSKHSVPQNAN